MAALPSRARVHRNQAPKEEAAPTRPSPDTRDAAATSTSPGRNLSQHQNPGPSQDLDQSRTVVGYNI